MKYLYLFLASFLLAPMAWAQHEHAAGHSGQPTIAPTGKVVTYDLYVKDTIVNYTGKKVKAIAVNGQIPAPTLHFTEGDQAVIRVHNQLKEETSTHWHGLLLPNAQDGVPYITTPPIHPGTTHTFEFPIIQSGTYWYHSHTSLQEQKGLYGSIVIHPKNEQQPRKEIVMLISDWTNENPHEVLRSLRRATDWYAIKKGNGVTQSWSEALVAGYLKDKFTQEWQRMAPMDVSDVYYNRFLINGLPKSDYSDISPGDTVKLRLINGSASTYFWVHYAGGPMQVVAADGNELQPVQVDRLLIAVAETYDVLVTIPKEGSFELRATAQDISGFASAFLGKGMSTTATNLPRLNYFAMMREMNQMMKGGHVMGQHNPVVAETMPKEGNQVKTINHEGMDMSAGTREKQTGKSSTQKDAHQGHTMPSVGSTTNHQEPAAQNKKKNKKSTATTDHSQHHYPMNQRQGNASQEKVHDMSAMDHKAMKMDEKNQPDTSQEIHTMPADSMSNMQHQGHTMSMKSDTAMKHENRQREDTVSASGQHKGHSMPEAKQETDSTIAHQGHAMGDMTMWGPSTMSPQISPGEVLLSYTMLKGVKPTTLNPANPVQDVNLTLTGNMNRYVWGMNGKTLSESAYIPIKKGHTVRFIITNGTMMRHPMHLHGHFFRLLNGQGAFAPLKHTFDSEPMATDTLEFFASEEKDWLFHCHILYHMVTGMHRIVRYEGTKPDSTLVSHPGYKHHMREDRKFFSWGEVALHSQGAFADFAFENTRYGFELEGRVNWKGEFETETHVLRYFGRNQFLQVVAGTDFRRNKSKNDSDVKDNSKDDRQVAHIGVRYMLPLFVQGELRLDHTGKVRAQLRRLDWGLTPRLRMDWMVNTDKEYSVVMRYVLKKHLALSGNYDSDYGFGAGLSIIW